MNSDSDKTMMEFNRVASESGDYLRVLNPSDTLRQRYCDYSRSVFMKDYDSGRD